MRDLHAAGWPQARLAAMFGASGSTISRIIRGKVLPEAGGPIKTEGRNGRRNRKACPN